MNDEMLERIAGAAKERGGAIVRPTDRPSQRRGAGAGIGGPAGMPARATIQMRAVGDSGLLNFHGVASAYERAYEMWDMFGPYTEIVSAGAGAESLARADLDVPLVLQHQSLRRIARTTTGTLMLRESDEGLEVDAPELDQNDHDVAYIRSKIESRLIDEMSFMFRIELGRWSPDYTEYRIDKYDIHRGDVAIVGYGANPHTSADFRADVIVESAKRGIDVVTIDDIRHLPRIA
jgi:hypothetical protein